MDLKATIDTLDKTIKNLEEEIESLKIELKENKRKRSAFLKLEEKAKELTK